MNCFILRFEVEVSNRPKDAPNIVWQEAPKIVWQDAPKIVWPSFPTFFLDFFQFFFVKIITLHRKKATYVHNTEIWLVLNLQGPNTTETNWLIFQCDTCIIQN